MIATPHPTATLVRTKKFCAWGRGFIQGFIYPWIYGAVVFVLVACFLNSITPLLQGTSLLFKVALFCGSFVLGGLIHLSVPYENQSLKSPQLQEAFFRGLKHGNYIAYWLIVALSVAMPVYYYRSF